MLHKSHISKIEIYTPEWDAARLGRMTSSRIVALTAKEGFGTGAISYIDQKACEFVTGKVSAPEDEIIDDENTLWGLEWEPKALNSFGVKMGLKYLVVQRMIFNPQSRFSSTPDALWVIESSVFEEDCYNVASVEVKCPRKYPRFMLLYRCTTPAMLKKTDPKYYWQVIDQMDNCGSSRGYFVAYHPYFPPEKNMRIIEFNKIDLWDDFKFLKQRKDMALIKFTEVASEFLQ